MSLSVPMVHTAWRDSNLLPLQQEAGTPSQIDARPLFSAVNPNSDGRFFLDQNFPGIAGGFLTQSVWRTCFGSPNAFGIRREQQDLFSK